MRLNDLAPELLSSAKRFVVSHLLIEEERDKRRAENLEKYGRAMQEIAKALAIHLHNIDRLYTQSSKDGESQTTLRSLRRIQIELLRQQMRDLSVLGRHLTDSVKPPWRRGRQH